LWMLSTPAMIFAEGFWWRERVEVGF
jgi:hypothetical protein